MPGIPELLIVKKLTIGLLKYIIIVSMSKYRLENLISGGDKKAVWRDGENCVKLFKKDFKKSDVLNEALNYAKIEETGLSVPEIKEVAEIDGKLAIVTKFVSGKTLESLIRENPAKTDGYLEVFVKLQLEYQSKKCTVLNRMRDKLIEKIKRADILATTKTYLYNKIDDFNESNVVCHGDYNPSNVIIDESGKAYIIDWSHVTSGNALAEAARSYILFILNYGEDMAEKYLEKYEILSGNEKSSVKKFVPVIAGAMLYTAGDGERETLNNLIGY